MKKETVHTALLVTLIAAVFFFIWRTFRADKNLNNGALALKLEQLEARDKERAATIDSLRKIALFLVTDIAKSQGKIDTWEKALTNNRDGQVKILVEYGKIPSAVINASDTELLRQYADFTDPER